MNIDIWVVGTTNEIFAKGSETEARFLKNGLITSKMSFFVIGSFCTLHSNCVGMSFWQGNFVWKCCVFNLSSFN